MGDKTPGGGGTHSWSSKDYSFICRLMERRFVDGRQTPVQRDLHPFSSDEG